MGPDVGKAVYWVRVHHAMVSTIFVPSDALNYFARMIGFVILQQKSFQIFRAGSLAARRSKASSSLPTAAGAEETALENVAKIAIGRIVFAEPDGIAAIVFAVVVNEFPVPGFVAPRDDGCPRSVPALS